MPFINTKVNVPMSSEQELTLKTEFGKAASLIRKSENWLMLDFEDNCRMYFRGDNAPAAMVQVSLYGKASSSYYEAMTRKLTELLVSVMGIPADRIYVKYDEISNWGFAGSNF